jgi:tetratricopeptide (TPR) repeat protein
MSEETVCPNCGKAYSGAVCPDCGEMQKFNLLPSLPLVGFIFLVLLLIGFSVTRVAVQSSKAKQRSIADEWQRRGESDLNSGQAEAAIEDFENALVYDRENASYRMQLATALVGAGRYDEAQSHLRSLWDERPGDSLVNLQLARLKARSGDLQGAERYFEGAIYGVWPEKEDPYDHREQVRLEFAEALIHAKLYSRAEAQLVSLSGELPAGSSKRKQVGDLLMQAGAPRLAFEQYSQARARKQPVALEMAKAAFAENDFALANKWSAVAVREEPKSEAAAEFATVTSKIIESDPYQSGLGELGRALRVIHAFHVADTRMSTCFPTYTLGPHSREATAKLAELPAATMNQVANFSTWAAQLRSQMNARQVRHRDDLQENAMRFVFQTEQFATKNCKLPMTADDTALNSLAKERWSNE